MKLLLLAIGLLILCIVLFILGVFSPDRSRRAQRAVDDLSKKAEDRSDKSGGRLGDLTRDALETARGAADASARAGRRANQKMTGEEPPGRDG